MTTHVLTSEKMTFIVLRIDRAISKGLERGRSTRKIQKKKLRLLHLILSQIYKLSSLERKGK
jgi:hypothetical protein